MERLKKRNSFLYRVMFLVTGALLTLFLILSFLSVTWIRSFILNNYRSCGQRATTVINNSMYHNMLANRRDETQQIATNVAKNDDVVSSIILFNKAGDIMVASDTSMVGQTVAQDSKHCVACHNHPNGVSRETIFTFMESKEGNEYLNVQTPIFNEPSCYTAACHWHNKDEVVLGTMEVDISLGSLKSLMQRALWTYHSVAIIFTLIVLAAAYLLIHKKVHMPLRQFIDAVQNVGAGNLEYRISIDSNDEFSLLAEKFNTMSADLQKSKNELVEWSHTLEEKVEEKASELKNAHDHLIQLERMASLGKLSASVAHEVNNPLAGILTYAKVISRSLKRSGIDPIVVERVLPQLEDIQDEARRCGEIVKNLMTFARQERVDFSPVSLHTEINKVMALVNHHLEMKNITEARNLNAAMDQIAGDRDQIRQALIALVINAVEAMDEEGELRIFTENNSKEVTLRIQDNGVGIDAKDLPHIFEPFFTRKESGGTGLGLAVVYGIVKRHNATIDVDSTPGVGTTFTLVFPGVSHEYASAQHPDRG